MYFFVIMFLFGKREDSEKKLLDFIGLFLNFVVFVLGVVLYILFFLESFVENILCKRWFRENG